VRASSRASAAPIPELAPVMATCTPPAYALSAERLPMDGA